MEFKSSLRFDFATGKVNKELTKVVAKTIAGFLNADGGSLLIGVDDEGVVKGIGDDMKTLPRQSTDGFEQNLRLSLGNYLGVEVTPSLIVVFERMNGETVACIHCEGWHEPVFFKDGERQEFYVRDGNLTRPLDVRASHEYITRQWASEDPVNEEAVKALIDDALRGLSPPAGLEVDAVTPATPSESVVARSQHAAEVTESLAPSRGEFPPPWLQVATRRVLNLFLGQLASSQGWKRLYIISPWISELAEGASLSFDLFLQRLKKDGTTVYLVTRPPEEPWHEAAVAKLADTGRVNVAFVADLHVKLYTALTSQGAFAMLGSANFTQQSLSSREIGLLVNAYLEGKSVVRDLNYEASQIYRMPGRRLAHKADFRAV